jgi:branched-chain amino acid transport system substrate-binding protein
MQSPAVLLALATLAVAVRGADPIKIGAFASLTGKEAGWGQTSHRGIVLAIEEINAAGGVLGRQLELITEDNQSKSGESATAARKLLSRDKVIALIGEIASGRTLEVAPIAQAARVPLIAPAATNPKVTQAGNYVFRVCFIDDFQSAVLAKFARDELRARKVAILTSASNAYSVSVTRIFKATFAAAGGEIVAEKSYAEGDKDFRAQLTALKTAAMDAVFVPGYFTEAALIARQARELGIRVPFFGGDGWDDEQLLKIGGAALDGCFFLTHFSAEDTAPVVVNFVARYQARWGGESPGAYSALGYDAIGVLADALRRAGSTDGPRLRDALAATKDFPGVAGRTTIDPERNASKPGTFIAVRGGRALFYKSVSP